MTRSSYDVVIIGGGVIGSSVAYALKALADFGGTVLLLERDMSFRTCSTALSCSGIRQQFSNEINIKISQYGLEVILGFAEDMAVDGPHPGLDFQGGGYLYLASDEDQAATLRANHVVQMASGAPVSLLAPDKLAQAFPHLNTADLALAAYGGDQEGWFDSVGMMSGFRNKARALGVEVRRGEVVALDRNGSRVAALLLADGTRLSAGTVVNAAGARAAQVAALAGVHLPIEPRKRTIFSFTCAENPEGSARVNGGRLPLMIDPTGVFCRPEGAGFIAGCTPPEDMAVGVEDFEPRYHEFEEVIWPALAARSPAFEALRVTGQWAGHYAYNTLDHNLIIGAHPEVENLIFANGFSGHGLQQAPATGRAVAELICFGAFRSLDLSPLSFERVMAGEPFLERNVI